MLHYMSTAFDKTDFLPTTPSKIKYLSLWTPFFHRFGFVSGVVMSTFQLALKHGLGVELKERSIC